MQYLLSIGLMGTLAVALVSPATAQDLRSGEASFDFHATSTLKDFSGTAVAEPFVLEITDTPEGRYLAGTVTVAVARMDTGHAKRDQNMRRMFDEPNFPFMIGVLPPTPMTVGENASVLIDLTIRDQTTTVPVQLSGWREDEQGIALDLEMTLSLDAIGLNPPVFLGVLRVGDTVTVRGEIRLRN